MIKYILIGLYGLVGVFARYAIGVYFGKDAASSSSFPYGTFTINLVGCFLIGVIYVVGIERTIISHDLRVAIMVGLLGGFTTFSAYSFETVMLFKNQESFLAVTYMLASSVCGVLLTSAGILITRILV